MSIFFKKKSRATLYIYVITIYTYIHMYIFIFICIEIYISYGRFNCCIQHMLNEAEAVNIAFCIRVRVTTSLCWLFIVRVACWHSFFRSDFSRLPAFLFSRNNVCSVPKTGTGWKAFLEGCKCRFLHRDLSLRSPIDSVFSDAS